MCIDIYNTIPPGFDLVSLGKDGPLQVRGMNLVAGYMAKRRGLTKTQETIGNIKYLWHGANVFEHEWPSMLRSYAKKGLLRHGLNSDELRYCPRNKRADMLGPAVYLTPDIHKAYVFLSLFKDAGFLFRCSVSLGNVLEVTEPGDYSHECSNDILRYNSVCARPNKFMTGMFGYPTLAHTEYAIFNPNQVKIIEIYVYVLKEEQKRTSVASLKNKYARNSMLAKRVSRHPCKRDGNICSNAVGHIRCILKGKSYMCSKDDVKYCPSFHLAK